MLRRRLSADQTAELWKEINDEKNDARDDRSGARGCDYMPSALACHWPITRLPMKIHGRDDNLFCAGFSDNRNKESGPNKEFNIGFRMLR